VWLEVRHGGYSDNGYEWVRPQLTKVSDGVYQLDSGRGCCIGRPFVINGHHVQTPMITASIHNNDNNNALSTTIDKTAVTAQLIAAAVDEAVRNQRRDKHHWRQQMLDEHASIANYAAFTLQLMIVGAPSRLLDAALQAQHDKIVHYEASIAMVKALDMNNTIGELPNNAIDSLQSQSLQDLVKF
jgi:hypothetical protein